MKNGMKVKGKKHRDEEYEGLEYEGKSEELINSVCLKQYFVFAL